MQWHTAIETRAQRAFSTTMMEVSLSQIDTGNSQYCDCEAPNSAKYTWSTVLLSFSKFDGVGIGISSV